MERILSSDEVSDYTSISLARKYNTPIQDTLNAKISLIEKELIAAIEGRDSGLIGPEIQKKINDLKKNLEENIKLLTKKENKAKLTRKYRLQRKQALSIIKTENPDVAKALHVS